MASVDIGPHAAAWLPAGMGDFHNDGTSDLAWYNAATGDTEAWLLSNGRWGGGVNIGPHSTAWRPAGHPGHPHSLPVSGTSITME